VTRKRVEKKEETACPRGGGGKAKKDEEVLNGKYSFACWGIIKEKVYRVCEFMNS